MRPVVPFLSPSADVVQNGEMSSVEHHCHDVPPPIHIEVINEKAGNE
jgi:hypothetical protein